MAKVLSIVILDSYVENYLQETTLGTNFTIRDNFWDSPVTQWKSIIRKESRGSERRTNGVFKKEVFKKIAYF